MFGFFMVFLEMSVRISCHLRALHHTQVANFLEMTLRIPLNWFSGLSEVHVVSMSNKPSILISYYVPIKHDSISITKFKHVRARQTPLTRLVNMDYLFIFIIIKKIIIIIIMRIVFNFQGH
jgi:hypothetical protein